MAAIAPLRCALASAFVVALTFAPSAGAQGGVSSPPPSEPPPPAAAPASNGCFPACREGFVCTKDARCVSSCNPPCPPDQFCIEGRRCDYAPPPGPVHEPPPPPRVGFAERSHSLLAFHYGFSSALEVAGEDGPSGPVLGVNARTDMPVARYFIVGPMLEFASAEPGYYFDLDLTLRARVPIETASVNFQLWAGMPVGLTFNFLSDDFARSFSPDLDRFSLGWNIGVLFGGAVHFSREFGLFTEGGFQQHRMSHDRVTTGSVELVLRPWIWNVGFAFRG